MSTARWLPVALAALSGAAGLAHQLLWVRRMVDILGANAGTFSRVVAAFFLGLAAGAWWAARKSTPQPWRSVARAECVVALLALGMIFAGQHALPWPAHPALARGLPWLLPLVLIAPPAFAMGTVVPWMIRGAGAARAVTLYGANTFGGIAGLALVVVWALPTLGLVLASALALALNLLVAAGAWTLPSTARAAEPAAAPREALSFADAATAFASGFLVLASEVIFQHQFAQLFISSHLAGALVLALVLVALALGSALVPAAARLGAGALPLALTAAAIATAAQPLTLVVQRGGLIYVPFHQPLGSYLLEALRVGLPACTALLLPAALVFPLLLWRVARAQGDAGRILAINGLGGWCGAELGERFVAPVFGLWWSMTVLAAGYGACVLLQPARGRWLLAAALLPLLAWSWQLDARLPYAGLARGDQLVKVAVGREGVVGVVRGEPDDWRLLFNNTYTLGGSRAQTNQERQTLLPMLLHGDARRVATLGTATGSSLAGATLDPRLEHAEGIDLSPLVLRFSREDFGEFNRGVADDPRVRLTLGDARLVIAQRPASFDVIAGDLFLPWRTGESRLFAREHFASVRRALRPGGLFCQWLPMYQLTRAQFDTIARTFREVFPEAWMVRGDFYSGMPLLGLLGGRSLASIEWEKVDAACARVRLADACRDPLLRHAEGVAMGVVGALPPPPPGPLNTLANGWLEWDAARNVIGLREPWFVGVPLATFLRDAQEPATAALPENLRDAHRAGGWFHAVEIAAAAQLPQSTTLRAQTWEKMPAALRDDPRADWRRWPMKLPLPPR